MGLDLEAIKNYRSKLTGLNKNRAMFSQDLKSRTKPNPIPLKTQDPRLEIW